MNGRGSIVRVTEVVCLIAEPGGKVLSIGEKACSRQSNVLVDGLYPAVTALHQELGVEETLNAENNAIAAADTDCDTVTRQ